MRMSAKNTLYSEALIFILELLSQVKLDCHENLLGALICGDLWDDQMISSQVDWKLLK